MDVYAEDTQMLREITECTSYQVVVNISLDGQLGSFLTDFLFHSFQFTEVILLPAF